MYTVFFPLHLRTKRPPLEYEGDFFVKKAFHGGNFFLVNTWGEGVLYCGTNGQIMPRERWSFTNPFSNNLDTVNLTIFPNHEGYTLEDKSLASL